jgi:hypothetical protein
LNNVRTDQRVKPHQLPFFFGQWPRLAQDRIRDADLADIVEHGCPITVPDFAITASEFPPSTSHPLGDRLAVMPVVGYIDVYVSGEIQQQPDPVVFSDSRHILLLT